MSHKSPSWFKPQYIVPIVLGAILLLAAIITLGVMLPIILGLAPLFAGLALAGLIVAALGGLGLIAGFSHRAWEVDTYGISLPFDKTSIPYGYCYSNQEITHLSLPEGFKRIDSFAFSFCNKLKSVNLPNTLLTIDNEAFSNCTALTSITLPEGLTSIGMSAFSGSALQSIELPEGLTSISEQTFYNCTALTNITLPKGLTSIDMNAFSKCTALTSITLPEGLTSIGICAFSGCTALTNITLPKELTSIGINAFSGCTALQSIVITAATDNHFQNIKSQIPERLQNIVTRTYPQSVHSKVTESCPAAGTSTPVTTSTTSKDSVDMLNPESQPASQNRNSLSGA